MQVFRINKAIEIVAQSERTRYGFRHLATLLKNGVEVADAKACYYNRTWERYTFETVALNVVEAADRLSIGERLACRRYLKSYGQREHDDARGLRMIAGIAKLGDILAPDQASKNDWKRRMLAAGLGDALIMPEDWPTLTEDEKTRRLDGAINQLTA